MKKNIVFVLAVAAALVVGIVIGKTTFFDHSVSEEKNKTPVDTAMINAEIKFENKYPTYMIAGGRPDIKDRYRYIVDNWYNFRFSVNGTTCTDLNNQIIDINRNNRTDSILKKRIGKNWMEKFEKSVDSLYHIDSLAIHIAENSETVKNAIREKAKTTNAKRYIDYKCYPTTNKNLKIVSVEWTGLIYKDSIMVSFLRAIVDIKSKKVKEIEKTERDGINSFYY